MSINSGASDFLGILFVIGTYAFLTEVFLWGFYQIIKDFIELPEEKEHQNIFHHHYHYKAK